MKYKLISLTLCCMLFLTSCWDQRLLKESKIVYSSGYDLEKDDDILVTTVIRTNALASTDPTQAKTTNFILNSKGKTLSDNRLKLHRMIPGDYATNKLRVLVLGNTLAKQDIYPIFDIVYRDPRSSLGAKVVVAMGRADEILNLKMVEETLIGEDILKLITTAEQQTIVPEENVQSICTLIFDPGNDVVLPLIQKNEEKVVSIAGLALFNGQIYTGYNLLDEEPTLLLLLKNQLKKYARFTLEVNPKKKDIRERYISIQVKKNKPKMKISVSKKNKITINMNLKLEVEALEYPKDKLYSTKEVKKLNKELSKQLTIKTEKVIKTLQKSNCDALGIGRQLISFHPNVWKKIHWNKEYPNISIKPNVDVKIVGTGILE
ncbi:Ger(x)C family spore germination protein [Gottfriedia luciferensis]|uniref:Ger(x)C family spore germination protein n=1 Tax=Gottfriedia luciferensis TaxID=178774 RepID=UPI001154FE85|nr:Ger(x)C family spore germination protein [Gottfriedia luciferensis]